MTCIVAVQKGTNIYMAGDLLASTEYTKRICANSKVFKKGPYLIGYTTSFRMGQILQFGVQLPDPASPEPHPFPTKRQSIDLEFMVTKFVPVIRDAFKTAGFTRIDSNQEEGGQFLVGCSHGLYCIQSDFQVSEYADHYNAIGCGAYYALGYLYGYFQGKDYRPARSVLKGALRAAHKFSMGVSAPFTFESLEEVKEGDLLT